jgi:ATP-binding cassette, subfamily B, bacterial PglK
MNLLNKINKILNKKLRLYLFFIFSIIFLTMLLETLSLASFYPFLELLTSGDNIGTDSKLGAFYLNLLSLFEYEEDKLFVVTLSVVSILYVIKIFILLFCNWHNSNFEFAIRFYLTKKLYKTYLNKNYQSLLKYNSADIIKNVDYEISMVQSGISGLMTVLTEGIIFTGIIIFLFFFNAKVTLSILIFCIIIFLILQFSYNKLLVLWGNISQKYHKLRTQNFIETFNAIKEIKIFRKEELFYDLMDGFNKKFFSVNRKENFLRNIPRATLELSLILIASGYLISLFNKGYDFENYFAQVGIYLIAAYRAFPSINRIIVALQRFKFSSPYITNISHQIIGEGIINQKSDIKDPNKKIIFSKNLRIQDCSFKYNENEKILDKVSFNFQFGKMYGIKGASGSGKTTLLNIISGLLKPTEGKIFVDEKKLDLTDNRSFYGNISYVPQNIFLFDTSIAKNIHLEINEQKKYNKDLIEYLVKKLGLNSKISNLKNGLDTNVGERGVNLSGGQIQRIGIARALYHQPKLLILDEATNAIEKHLEENVLDYLNSIKDNKIIILVAHRDSALKNCDEIFNLKTNINK